MLWEANIGQLKIQNETTTSCFETLRRQYGRVVSGAGLESRSDHYLDLFYDGPGFRSSATDVNSQLVCIRPVGIF